MDSEEARAPGIVLSGILIVVGWIWIFKLSEDDQFTTLFRFFIFAFAIRLFVSVLLHYTARWGLFAEDYYLYQEAGEKMANAWKSFTSGIPQDFVGDEPKKSIEMGYVYVMAFFFYVFGPGQIAPKVFNCFVGAMTVVYFLKITWAIYGKKPVMYVGVLCSIFPSLVLWSALALKDPIATFCIVYIIWLYYLTGKNKSPVIFIKMIIAFFILSKMRDYMFLIVLGSIASSHFLKGSKHRLRNYAIGMIILTCAFFLYQYLQFGNRYGSGAVFEQLNYHRKALATGDSAIHMDADISSPGKALLFLPIGISYFIFAPFPWDVKGQRQLFALPEVLVWYFLFFYFIRGLIYSYKKHFIEIGHGITIMFLVTITYSLVEGNLGTAYRHRSQIMGIYLLFTGIGLCKSLMSQNVDEKCETSQINKNSKLELNPHSFRS